MAALPSKLTLFILHSPGASRAPPFQNAFSRPALLFLTIHRKTNGNLHGAAHTQPQ
ncbi:hypothetical protein TPCCA_0971a [Treponema paraluiscuniculi Cuniculi A]|uniref:Uncharacterized protein n=2 Tax=Treponema paraluiscuniculi TaxID=53435 RepID=F7XR46_TREPU|nr:hypothetical protein TPCCA_0971a [Treponema paraluiscuniculi Cuniculi A]WKC72824.1 hypothetical protein TPLL2_0971a [Treponema paraluiscuniculi]